MSQSPCLYRVKFFEYFHVHVGSRAARVSAFHAETYFFGMLISIHTTLEYVATDLEIHAKCVAQVQTRLGVIDELLSGKLPIHHPDARASFARRKATRPGTCVLLNPWSSSGPLKRWARKSRRYRS